MSATESKSSSKQVNPSRCRSTKERFLEKFKFISSTIFIFCQMRSILLFWHLRFFLALCQNYCQQNVLGGETAILLTFQKLFHQEKNRLLHCRWDLATSSKVGSSLRITSRSAVSKVVISTTWRSFRQVMQLCCLGFILLSKKKTFPFSGAMSSFGMDRPKQSF